MKRGFILIPLVFILFGNHPYYPVSDTIKQDTVIVKIPVQMDQKIVGQISKLDSLILEKQKKIKE